MAYQTDNNVLVAIKRETTTGTAATATGATQVRIIDSAGLELKHAVVQSNEKRSDGLSSMGRLGGKMVDGSFSSELSVGGHVDIALEAIMRGTWSTATAISFASVTTIAFLTNTISCAAGSSFVTQGLRVGDIFKVSSTTVSGNNDINVPILALTTQTITVPAGTFTTLAATATGTLTRLKKLINGSTPTRYSHTIEQYDQITDLSELFLGCRLIGLSLSFRPNQMATVALRFLGMDRTVLTTGTSPWFTSPTLTTGLSLLADDSSIRYNGAAVATFTGFDLDFSINAATEQVIGSTTPADVFDNDLTVTGSISGLRSDFSNLTLFDAETEFELGILLQEPTTAPKPCVAIFLPRVKISRLSAPVGGGDGAKVETLQLMTGPKVATTVYDGTVAVISSSAA